MSGWGREELLQETLPTVHRMIALSDPFRCLPNFAAGKIHLGGFLLPQPVARAPGGHRPRPREGLEGFEKYKLTRLGLRCGCIVIVTQNIHQGGSGAALMVPQTTCPSPNPGVGLNL